LLCFAGEFDRAEKHLDILSDSSKDASLGALLYRAALNAERTRADVFAKRDYPSTPAAAVSGTFNGKPFEDLTDGDPRIGARLEVYAAGQYLWLPFAHIKSVDMQPPRRLRDLLWAPALVRTGPAFKDRELGEVLVPVLTPLAWKHADDAVRLGRITQWEEIAEGEAAPAGQKVLLVDGEDFPILELRHLEIHASEDAADSHAAAQ
jgi:type VI secretion system protein ImpE